MGEHEAAEASEATDGSPASEPDIQEIISGWAGESRRLLLALPGILARLDELKEERKTLRNRLMDLEQENQTLRESRAELAETFAKLKELVAGTALDESQRNLGSEVAPEPTLQAAPETLPEPPPEPVREAAPDPAPVPPEPRPEPVAQSAPEPAPPSPEPTRSATSEPVRPADPEPARPANPEPARQAAPEIENETASESASPAPVPPQEDKRPLRRVESSPVRLASVFRPPAAKK
jgi:hypothetical protein